MDKQELEEFVINEMQKIKSLKIIPARWGYWVNFNVNNISIKIWVVHFIPPYGHNRTPDVFGKLKVKQGWFGKEMIYNKNIDDFLFKVHAICNQPTRNYELERDVRMSTKYGINW